jgi:predicted nucleic acid-binding protein
MDTCVIVTAFRSRNGAGRVVLDRVADRSLVPLLTPGTVSSVRGRAKAAGAATGEPADQILAALASAVEPVTIHYSWRPQLADAGDELVLEAAVNGRADALVTYNIRHFANAAALFSLRVAGPVEAFEGTPSSRVSGNLVDSGGNRADDAAPIWLPSACASAG